MNLNQKSIIEAILESVGLERIQPPKKDVRVEKNLKGAN